MNNAGCPPSHGRHGVYLTLTCFSFWALAQFCNPHGRERDRGRERENERDGEPVLRRSRGLWLMDLSHISAHLVYPRDLHFEFNDPPLRLIDFCDRRSWFLARGETQPSAVQQFLLTLGRQCEIFSVDAGPLEFFKKFYFWLFKIKLSIQWLSEIFI